MVTVAIMPVLMPIVWSGAIKTVALSFVWMSMDAYGRMVGTNSSLLWDTVDV